MCQRWCDGHNRDVETMHNDDTDGHCYLCQRRCVGQHYEVRIVRSDDTDGNWDVTSRHNVDIYGCCDVETVHDDDSGSHCGKETEHNDETDGHCDVETLHNDDTDGHRDIQTLHNDDTEGHLFCARGDVVRVGICQPLDVERFEVVMEYPVYVKNNATWYDNLDDLDADETGNAFFHDKKNGYRRCLAFCVFCVAIWYLCGTECLLYVMDPILNNTAFNRNGGKMTE